LKEFWSLNMPTDDKKHDKPSFPGTHGSGSTPKEKSPGYELSDVNISGTLIFIVGLLASCVVIFVVCWAMGKIIHAELAREDGPVSHWREGGPQDAKGDLVSNPTMEQDKLGQLVETFPTPRVQTDDGNEDIYELHAREDLYLENYSWVDESHTTVRIPIERAMELLVARGLPTAPAVQLDDTTYTGAAAPEVTAPLTNGFARTAYEQQAIETRKEDMNLEGPAK
jgi:hypothetical protein